MQFLFSYYDKEHDYNQCFDPLDTRGTFNLFSREIPKSGHIEADKMSAEFSKWRLTVVDT